MSTDAQPADPTDQPVCTPCSGKGTVISNLGGSPSTITCPWCEGSGHLLPDHDAQAAQRPSG